MESYARYGKRETVNRIRPGRIHCPLYALPSLLFGGRGTPRERFLADSNHLVYNEPLRLMVDYGVAGFLLYACFLYIALIIPAKRCGNFISPIAFNGLFNLGFICLSRSDVPYAGNCSDSLGMFISSLQEASLGFPVSCSHL